MTEEIVVRNSTRSGIGFAARKYSLLAGDWLLGDGGRENESSGGLRGLMSSF